MSEPEQLQHYIVREDKGVLFIRQEQFVFARPAAIFALGLIFAALYLGPYGPVQPVFFTKTIFFTVVAGLGVSAGVGLYFASYIKTWAITSDGVSIRSTATAEVTIYRFDQNSEIVLGPTRNAGAGKMSLKAFAYTIEIKFRGAKSATLEFVDRETGEKMLEKIGRALPAVKIRRE